MKKISIVLIIILGIILTGTVFAEEKKSSDATLKNLGIIPNDFTTFKSNVLEYDIEVENECTEVEVYAETTSSKAKTKGTGNVKLKVGINILPVVITAEDGTTKTYTMNIDREEGEIGDEKLINKPIKSIEIEDVKLDKDFNSEIFVYDGTYIGTKKELEVKVESDNKDYVINIVGNNNLEDGNNTVTVLCTNTEDKTTLIYQINIIKNKAQKVVQTQNLKNQDNTVLYIILGIAVIVIIITIVLIIKESKRRK